MHSGAYRRAANSIRNQCFGRTAGVSRSKIAFWACGGIEMWSMWNAPSDCDYYDSLGVDCDQDEPKICEDCGARWDRGEACEQWCATNRAEPEPASASCLAVEEEEVANE
jgi:hypothetical protein